MGALDRYLLRRTLSAFAIAFLAVAGLAVSLDLLANANKAIRYAGDVSGIWTYGVARLPLIALKLTPIAGLLAALTTLLNLARSGELSAAGSIGASQARIVRAILPAAVAVGLALFAIGEFAAPPAAAMLREMGLEPFSRIARPTEAIWLRDGDDVARIGGVSVDENRLDDVTIFRRDSRGRLAYEIRAERAERQDGGWRLHAVEVLTVATAETERGDFMDWLSPLGPKSFKLLASHPSELSLRDIHALADASGASPRPSFFYAFWAQRKFAIPVSAGLLLLLAAPFAGRLTRNKSMATPLALGLLAGFVYFVFENLVVAAAESGAITPVAGAWGPPAILACAIVGLLTLQEKPG